MPPQSGVEKRKKRQGGEPLGAEREGDPRLAETAAALPSSCPRESWQLHAGTEADEGGGGEDEWREEAVRREDGDEEADGCPLYGKAPRVPVERDMALRES